MKAKSPSKLSFYARNQRLWGAGVVLFIWIALVALGGQNTKANTNDTSTLSSSKGQTIELGPNANPPATPVTTTKVVVNNGTPDPRGKVINAASRGGDTKVVTSNQITVATTDDSTPAANPLVVSPPPSNSVSPTISLSADGCSVTATGDPGLKLVYGGMSSDGLSGAEFNLVIPASSIVTVSTGGAFGMTSYGKIYDATNNLLASGSTTITATQCAAPSV